MFDYCCCVRLRITHMRGKNVITLRTMHAYSRGHDVAGCRKAVPNAVACRPSAAIHLRSGSLTPLSSIRSAFLALGASDPFAVLNLAWALARQTAREKKQSPRPPIQQRVSFKWPR